MNHSTKTLLMTSADSLSLQKRCNVQQKRKVRVILSHNYKSTTMPTRLTTKRRKWNMKQEASTVANLIMAQIWNHYWMLAMTNYCMDSAKYKKRHHSVMDILIWSYLQHYQWTKRREDFDCTGSTIWNLDVSNSCSLVQNRITNAHTKHFCYMHHKREKQFHSTTALSRSHQVA